MRPLRSVDLETGEPGEALVERSDVQAVEALAVVAEAAVAWELARAAREKFGGDALVDFVGAHAAYLERIAWPHAPRSTPRARRLHGRGEVDARPASRRAARHGRSYPSTRSSRSERDRCVASCSRREARRRFASSRSEAALDVLSRRPLAVIELGAVALWLGAHTRAARRARADACTSRRSRRGLGARVAEADGRSRAIRRRSERSTRSGCALYEAAERERARSRRRGPRRRRHPLRAARRRARDDALVADAARRRAPRMSPATPASASVRRPPPRRSGSGGARARPRLDARRARWWLDDRRRRLRRRHVHARDRLDRGAVDARRPGGRCDRREGRDRPSGGQEPRRRVPLAGAHGHRHRRSSTRSPTRSCENGLAEVVKTGLLAGEPLWELDTAEQVRRCAAFKAAVCLRDPLRARRARAAQPRSHVRARARGRLRLLACRTVTRSRSGCSPRCASRASTTTPRIVEDVLRPDPGRGRPRRAWAALAARQEGDAAASSTLVLLDAPGRPRADVPTSSRSASARLSTPSSRRVSAVRIVVLNGANLDVLGHRDPELYGGLGLSELETRIYQWALELECTVRCRQTNHEGEFIDWCHEAYEWADGVIVNPGRVGALLVGDPRRARALHGARRRGAPLEHRRARGVAALLGARGRRRGALHREGARRLPRGDRVPRREGSA